MFKYLIMVALAISPIFAGKFQFEECSNGEPKPTNVDIVGCNESPCDFPRGNDANMLMTFMSPVQGLKDLKASVVVSWFDLDIPYELPAEQIDVCDGLQVGSCPFDENEDAVLPITLPILSDLPEMTVPFQFYVKDITGNTIACFRFSAKLC